MRSMRFGTLAALAVVALLAACGGGKDEEAGEPGARVPLGGAVLVLAAEPYRNSMPIAYTPSQPMSCQNLIVPVRVSAVEGVLPAGLSLGRVSLHRGLDEVWSEPVAEQGHVDGKLQGVARGCPTDKTAPGTTVRVLAEVRHGGGSRWLFTDALIGEAH